MSEPDDFRNDARRDAEADTEADWEAERKERMKLEAQEAWDDAVLDEYPSLEEEDPCQESSEGN